MKLPRLQYALAFVIAALSLGIATIVVADSNTARIDAGRALAEDFAKGNCFACHSVPNDPAAVTKANIAPPLVDIRKRFSGRDMVRDQIWDPTQRNTNTVMPPFGKHRILSEEEIELIVDYVYTL